MPTPHIEAKEGAFAETILLPGDPLRAKFIAETFLDEVTQVNGVRNMFGYTGLYQGTPVSVMGSGMGIPSISIYAKELITDYGVKNLIRVGSCGAVSKSVKVRDVLIGMGGCTDSGVNRARFGGYDFAAIADYDLVEAHVLAARELEIPVKVGNLFSADLFYTPQSEMFDRMESMGVLAVEMEAAGLFGVCAEFGARGMAICTVSDHIRTGESTSSEEREKSFTGMMKIALEAAVRIS
ncbi:purine-nucleoside phosphorylase [Akkermansiaceae bacterium]|jgi:purine-nucleoside phosphorylase|nr:purine-nucleoside phosphorylase [Akkermansiaceae bacterium]MDB4576733.1 purine-nucleoside phosphorylase [Akkermansiaceae bacterium]MDB4726638.1 purine-nucleoside phosphorylase [bacterium]MDB4745385.1 purine-nucleoside phosphorylase [bacterium]